MSSPRPSDIPPTPATTIAELAEEGRAHRESVNLAGHYEQALARALDSAPDELAIRIAEGYAAKRRRAAYAPERARRQEVRR